MFSILLETKRNPKKGKQLVCFDHQMQILFALAIIMSTAGASLCFYQGEGIF